MSRVRDSDLRPFEDKLSLQILGSLEYDTSCLFMANDPNNERPLPFPTSVTHVDAALEIFSLLFPLQSATLQENLLESLFKTCFTTSLNTSGNKKGWIQINILVALIGAMR